MQELNQNTHYTGFTILGKSEKEEDRLYAKDNWMKLFPHLDRFFKEQVLNASITSYQVKWIVKKIDKNGMWRVTGKKIPAGGVQKWSEKACLKICTDEMEAHFKLLKQLSEQNLTLQKYIEQHFPEINSYFSFSGIVIYAYLDPDINVKHQRPGDLHFQIHNTLDPKNTTWDQEIDVLFSDRLIEKCRGQAEELIRQTALLSKSVSTQRAEFIAGKMVKNSPDSTYLAYTAILGHRFGQINSLDLRKDAHLQLSSWEEFK